MLIAHDLGTTGNKASFNQDDGHPVAAVTVAYGVRFADGGVAEQDPEDWWERGSSRRHAPLLARTGADPASVVGMAVSGRTGRAVLLDAQYQPVRPAIIWADTRSTEQTAALERF